MTKVILNDVTDLRNPTTSKATINNNYSTIETAFDNTLSRDGTSPNTMSASLDMNSNSLLNLPYPASATEPVRLVDLEVFLEDGTLTGDLGIVGTLTVGDDLVLGGGPVNTIFDYIPRVEFNFVGGSAVAIHTWANTQNNTADLYLAKSRGSAAGNYRIVQNGDNLASINFGGSDGAALQQTAYILNVVDGVPALNSVPSALHIGTTAVGDQFATDRIIINNSGLIEIATPGANADLGISGVTAATKLNVFDGTAGGPFESSTDPTVLIWRNESNNGAFNSHSAALNVGVTGNAITNGYQSCAVIATAAKSDNCTGDVVGMQGFGYNYGATGAAFGAFFAAARINTGDAIAVAMTCQNGTASPRPYSPTVGDPVACGLDIEYQGTFNASTSVLGGPAIQVRASNNQWDVGIGFMNDNPIKTADIQSDTNAVHILYAHSGSHTNGINLADATFSGSPILAPLMTPASSSATGTTGAIKWDANFIYICTTTNTWKRAALSTF